MKRQQPEAALHRAVVQHLERRAKPGVLWFHVPNGGKRDARTGAMMKRMGVKPGVADILLFRANYEDRDVEAFALELKAPGGRPTEAQIKFASDWEKINGFYCCAFDLDVVLAVLEAWGLIR